MVLTPAFTLKVMVFALHVVMHKDAPLMPLTLGKEESYCHSR